jgi:biotin carboxylase
MSAAATRRRRLLIVGAGHEQVPAIVAARALGHHVIATDRDPQAPGARHAHAFERISTADAPANLAAARRHGVDGVMTLGSETAVPVVAAIASVLALPGLTPATAWRATNKNAMREAFVAHGVPTVASRPVTHAAQAEDFAAAHPGPWVVKPSDCSGQRGVARIDDIAHLGDAVRAACGFSTDRRAIVETFAEGPEINVTAAVSGGRVTILSCSDRVTAAPPHFGIALEHVAPPALAPDALHAVREAAERAIHAIGLRDGVAYPQIIASPQGPRVVEIAARIPGGHMREVAWWVSGIDLVEFAIRQALGEADPLGACRRIEPVPALSVRFVTALDVAGAPGRLVRAVHGVQAAQGAPGVRLARVHLAPGQPLPALHSSAARFGAVAAVGATRDEARARSQAAAALLRVSLAPPKPALPAPTPTPPSPADAVAAAAAASAAALAH